MNFPWKMQTIADWADANAMAVMTQRNPWTGRVERGLSPRFQGIRPICLWCKTPVNRFTDYYDEQTRQFKFRFECHGREEIVPIDMEFIECNRDAFKDWLLNYRPFGGDADEQVITDQNGDTVAVAYIPRGTPVVRAPGGGIMPLSTAEKFKPLPPDGRPGPAYKEFVEMIISGMAEKIGIPFDALYPEFKTEYVPEAKPAPTKPKPKVEDFLLPARKPRIITLED